MKSFLCFDCEAFVTFPDDVEDGEIVVCPECGLEHVITITEKGYDIKTLTIEGEDWGE